MDDEKSTCGNCRYWERMGDLDGICRMAPPKLFVGAEQEDGQLKRYTYFPETDQGMWCGCHVWDQIERSTGPR